MLVTNKPSQLCFNSISKEKMVNLLKDRTNTGVAYIFDDCLNSFADQPLSESPSATLYKNKKLNKTQEHSQKQ